MGVIDQHPRNTFACQTVPVDLPRLVQLHNEHRNLSYDVNRMRAERNTLTDKLKALSKSAARGTEAEYACALPSHSRHHLGNRAK
jgi:hypothetical protein